MKVSLWILGWFLVMVLAVIYGYGCAIEKQYGDYTGKIFFTVEDVLQIYGEMTARGEEPFTFESRNGYEVGVGKPAEVVLEREEVTRLMRAVKGSRGFVHFVTKRGRMVEVTSALWE